MVLQSLDDTRAEKNKKNYNSRTLVDRYSNEADRANKLRHLWWLQIDFQIDFKKYF